MAGEAQAHMARSLTMWDISDPTLAEKAALGSGADMWWTKSVGPLPAVSLVDGPHGVRMPTCFWAG